MRGKRGKSRDRDLRDYLNRDRDFQYVRIGSRGYIRTEGQYIRMEGVGFRISKKIKLRGATKRRAATLYRAPGWKIRYLAEFLYSRRTFDVVFSQIIRDMQGEHIEALKDHRIWKARWIVVRGHGSFWVSVFAHLPVSILKKITEYWKMMI